MVTRNKWAAGLAAAAVIAATAWWATQHGPGQGNVASQGNGWDVIRPGGNAIEGDGAASSVSATLTADQVRIRLFRDGSLAGTEAAGDWCVNDGKLKPCLGLRQRFEYYILGVGEVSVQDLRTLVAVGLEILDHIVGHAGHQPRMVGLEAGGVLLAWVAHQHLVAQGRRAAHRGVDAELGRVAADHQAHHAALFQPGAQLGPQEGVCRGLAEQIGRAHV